MGRFIIRRLLQMIFVLWAVSVLTFLVFNVIPNSDPAVRMAGRHTSESTIEAIRKEWGFNDSLPQQYITTMKKVFTGDLKSQFTQLPVGKEIIKGLPAHVLARDRRGAPVDVRRGLLRACTARSRRASSPIAS